MMEDTHLQTLHFYNSKAYKPCTYRKGHILQYFLSIAFGISSWYFFVTHLINMYYLYVTYLYFRTLVYEVPHSKSA